MPIQSAALPYNERAAIERSRLETFDAEQGGAECRQIMRDWFPRLLARMSATRGADAELFDYEHELDRASSVLEEIRWAFTANESPPNGSPRRSIWAWPGLETLERRQEKWGTSTSPADADRVSDALTDYIASPWLQHNIIDGAAINALLFSEVAATIEIYKTGKLTGRLNWGYILSPDGEARGALINIGIITFLSLLRWIALPATGVTLVMWGSEMAGIIVLGIWAIYVLYRVLMVPSRWLRRGARRKADEKVHNTLMLMIKAWRYSRDPVINPSRLKELVFEAEQAGAVLKPVLHTLIDRAVQRDPAALLTRREQSA